jgi:hypothetical protein
MGKVFWDFESFKLKFGEAVKVGKAVDGLRTSGWMVNQWMDGEPVDGWWTKRWMVNQWMDGEPVDGWWTSGWMVNQKMDGEPVDGWWTSGWMVNQKMDGEPVDGWWTSGWTVNQCMDGEPLDGLETVHNGKNQIEYWFSLKRQLLLVLKTLQPRFIKQSSKFIKLSIQSRQAPSRYIIEKTKTLFPLHAFPLFTLSETARGKIRPEIKDVEIG